MTRMLVVLVFVLSAFSCSGEKQIKTESRSINYTAWIGAGGSTIEFENSHNLSTYTLYQSEDSICDKETVHTCSDLESTPLLASGENAVHFDVNNLTYFWLQNEREASLRSLIAPVQTHFEARRQHQTVTFNDRLWIIGGRVKRDIWSSDNGRRWRIESKFMPSPASEGMQAIEFNNRLWLFGGKIGNDFKQHIQSSFNGRDWVIESMDAYPAEHELHQVLFFNNKLYLLERKSTNGENPNIWVSDNGVDWQAFTTNLSISRTNRFLYAVFQNKLIAVAQMFDGKIRVSKDGESWQIINAENANFIRAHALSVLGDELILLGQDHNCSFLVENCFQQQWKSSDMVNWQMINRETARGKINFGFRQDPQLVAFKDSLWLVGGTEIRGDIGRAQNDAWSYRIEDDSWQEERLDGVYFSPSDIDLKHFNQLFFRFDASRGRDEIYFSQNAIDWQKVDHQMQTKYCKKSTAIFKGKLWMSCPERGVIYSSVDGFTWIEHDLLPNSEAYRDGRYSHLIEFDNTLWLFIATSRSDKSNFELWSSEDGENWRIYNPDLDFVDDVVKFFNFDNRLWVFLAPGESSTINTNSFKSSYDLSIWQDEAQIDEVPVRENSGLLVFNNNIWLFGGWTENLVGTLHDLWRSSDGKNWQAIDIQGEFKVPYFNTPLQHNGKLYLMGYEDKYLKTWRSINGEEWGVGYSGIVEFPRD